MKLAFGRIFKTGMGDMILNVWSQAGQISQNRPTRRRDEAAPGQQ